MKTSLRRAAGRLADVVHEMHDAQERMLVLHNAMDRYVENPNAAPDTYAEFLARTSGMLLHEPSVRKRIRRARRG